MTSGGGLHVNALDLVLALLFALASARGRRQGAISQVLVSGGFVVGLIAGLWTAPRMGALFHEGPGSGTAVLTVFVVLVAVGAGQGIGMLIAGRLRAVLRRSPSERLIRLDRETGMVAGGVGLLVVVWLSSGVLAQMPFPGVVKQGRESSVLRLLDARMPPPPDVLAGITAYLDDSGFPQVFLDAGGGISAPPVSPAAPAAVKAAIAAGRPGTVQIRAIGCGAVLSSGSGFVTRPGFVVTNAHVVAGFSRIRVLDPTGDHDATPILVDPGLDVAVLAATDVRAPALPWSDTAAERGTEGATLGFPGGRRQMVALPATVRARFDAVGRDIYARGTVSRRIVALAAAVEQGDSGGPFVTGAGGVAGVVFGADPGDRGTGYALAAEQVRPVVEAAIARNRPSGVGPCRF